MKVYWEWMSVLIRADISQVSWENGGGNDSTICLLLQHIYVYLSTTVAETRATLWHLTLVYTVFPFPAWAHYCAHLGSQPCPHCDAFNHPLQVSRSIAICNLSMSWYFYVTEFHFSWCTVSLWHHWFIPFHTHIWPQNNSFLPALLPSIVYENDSF